MQVDRGTPKRGEAARTIRRLALEALTERLAHCLCVAHGTKLFIVDVTVFFKCDMLHHATMTAPGRN